jgi:hypothetical protein
MNLRVTGVRVRSQRRVIALMGVGATLLMHLLLVTPMFWGGAANVRPRPPDATGTAANSGSAQGVSAERLILIELNSAADVSAVPVLAVTTPEYIEPASLVQLLGPDSLPLMPLYIDPDGDAAQMNEADLIARTRLAGIYESQIRARIERAWRRPRTPLIDNVFECQVKVWQDAQGYVQRVVLQECEGTPEWFDSMVNAVKAASPLPAPPNPRVFVDSFQMRFASTTYRSGGDEQGFEAEAGVGP